MKLLSFLFCLFLSSAGFAQRDTTVAYKRFPVVPPMALNTLDGKIFTKESLKKNIPVIIMFFSPKCDHCQKQIRDMSARMDEIAPTQIVLASYEPMEDLVRFTKDYNLDKFSNVHVLRDGQFMLPPFYRISSLPFIAIYNKKWDLVGGHTGNVSINQILKELKN